MSKPDERTASSMADERQDRTNSATEVVLDYILCSQSGQRRQLSGRRISIGTSSTCDVPFVDEQDVSPLHCHLVRERGAWSVEPHGENGVWVNDRRVLGREEVRDGEIIFLGRLMGPGLRISLSGARATPGMLRSELRGFRAYRAGLLASAAKAAAEKPFQRRVIRRSLQRQKKFANRRLRKVAGMLITCLLVVGGYAYLQQSKLSNLRGLAENIFYQMKNIELQVARVEDIADITGDAQALEQSKTLWTQFSVFEREYDAYLRELGVSDEKMPEDERLILKIARRFGESELNIPEDFVETVRGYIKKWQTTPRYREAIQRALKSGYIDYIARALIKNHLPPQLVYLAMQESDFDVKRCGPRTKFGIAKGMWQFIPTTAVYFGLKLGPLVDLRKPDPRDERHNFRKSTAAAIKYLRFLYTTEAQASALLVMASYNWGEGKVRKLINGLPQNPRERNFWALLKNYRLPKQTRDYVFYIFSAAVIGENPKLFGFEVEPPLTNVING